MDTSFDWDAFYADNPYGSPFNRELPFSVDNEGNLIISGSSQGTSFLDYPPQGNSLSGDSSQGTLLLDDPSQGNSLSDDPSQVFPFSYSNFPESLRGFLSQNEDLSSATRDNNSFNLDEFLKPVPAHLLEDSPTVNNPPPISYQSNGNEIASPPATKKRTQRSADSPDKPPVYEKKVSTSHVTPVLKDYEKRNNRTYSTSTVFLDRIAYVFEPPSFNFPNLAGFGRKRSDLRSFMVSPNHRNKLDAEQHIQFPEFQDRTFNLLGNSDEEKIQNFLPSPRRGIRISREDLISFTPDVFEKIQFVDARFTYEYQAGTIGHSSLEKTINVDEYWNLNKILDIFWELDNGYYSPRFQGKTLVIFCEFSSLRGPGLYRNITIIDHILLFSGIILGKKEPLSYPEIYILDGGFCEAYKPFTQHPSLSLIYNPLTEEAPGTYVSEFHQNSDNNWKSKQTYMDNPANYSPFFERFRMAPIFYIWNPFKASEEDEDYFSILKRRIWSVLNNQPISSPTSPSSLTSPSPSTKMQRVINSVIQ